MIVSTGTAPLFWYIYRPVSSEAAQQGGGFNVALYPDNRLVYCRYNSIGQPESESVFQLPSTVSSRYMTIVESQSWWMGRVPLRITSSATPRYASMLAFAGHPMFICEEINTLVLAPFNSQRGMYARRLRMMLESIAEMLYEYGIGMTVDSFVWDWQKICPINGMNGAHQMVQPSAEQMPGAEEELRTQAQ